ncbi:MAG: T9SS type A sorting domain-containing protein [Bacteroidales bacterium]|nr:T9SS type A sorting domain-containing protein [Bacteroidales bacterium]MBK7173601.1 T9SS type A sorting domain-containing protein [Bacteroidales bacterium]
MRKYLIFFLVLMMAAGALAQMVKPFAVNSTGGTAIISGNVYDWSFAEMALTETSVSPNMIVTAGLLQPIDPNVEVPELLETTIYLNVYPNPTADQLYLESNLKEAGQLMIQMYDLTGRLIKDQTTEMEAGNQLETIAMDQCTPGEYLLRVLFLSVKPDSRYQQTFKIQKVQ